MTNYDDKSVNFLFFSVILKYINIKLVLHCPTCSRQFHHQMKDDCRRENEQLN